MPVSWKPSSQRRSIRLSKLAAGGRQPEAEGPQVEPQVEPHDHMVLLLDLLVAMPEVIAWAPAKQRLEAALASQTNTLAPSAFATAYTGLLRAALALTPTTPTLAQARTLREAFTRLTPAPQASDVAWLSAQIGGWATLE